jgi:hypothetical protein
MSPPSGGRPIRCSFCVRRPLIATYGLDENRKPFIHIKVYKQKRIFANVVATGGPVHLQCRECNRWLRINFVRYREVRMREVEAKDVPGVHEFPVPAEMMDGV